MKTYCAEHDLVPRQWVESLIYTAIVTDYEIKNAERESAIVQKKERIEFFKPPRSDDLWAEPPFWDKLEDG